MLFRSFKCGHLVLHSTELNRPFSICATVGLRPGPVAWMCGLVDIEDIKTLPQFAISSALKISAYNDLTTLLQNKPDALLRLRAFSAQQWPAWDQHSKCALQKATTTPTTSGTVRLACLLPGHSQAAHANSRILHLSPRTPSFSELRSLMLRTSKMRSRATSGPGSHF